MAFQMLSTLEELVASGYLALVAPLRLQRYGNEKTRPVKKPCERDNTFSSASSCAAAVGTRRPRLFFVRFGTGTGGGTRERWANGDSDRAPTLRDADDVLRRDEREGSPCSGW